MFSTVSVLLLKGVEYMVSKKVELPDIVKVLAIIAVIIIAEIIWRRITKEIIPKIIVMLLLIIVTVLFEGGSFQYETFEIMTLGAAIIFDLNGFKEVRELMKKS